MELVFHWEGKLRGDVKTGAAILRNQSGSMSSRQDTGLIV